jgi:hypothetical protein
MIAALNYTSPVSVKAAGPVSHPVNNQARSAIPFALGAFFTPVAPSLADRVGQPQGWPAPDSGNANPIRSAAPFRIWCDGSCPQSQEPVMNPAVSVSPSPNPVLAAIADQAICNATSRNPMFRDEFYDRMSAVMDATELLESILAESAHHEFELIPQRLYGMVKLINRELKTVDALIDALKTAIEANPEIQRAIPNY